MIVTDRFVFIHLHKSGGTFVNQLLLKCVPGARRLGYHLPYAELPEEHRHLPVLGTVRNPWAYYVSWYFFQRQQARPNALFSICSNDGALDFDATIRNLALLHQDEARVEALASAFPDHFVAAGLNLTSRCIRQIAGSGRGFYTFLYSRMYAGADDLRLMRAETLRRDLEHHLVALIGPLPPLARLFLDQAPAFNASRHGPYRDYYDDALRDIVADADAPIISAQGYEF